MKKLVMLGATGHLRSIADSVIKIGEYEMSFILDDKTPVGTDVCGYKVTGNFDDLQRIYESGCRYAFVSAGSIGNYDKKKELYELALKTGFELINIIDPTASVAENAVFGKNIFVGKNAVVNSYAEIGDMACVNTGSIVEHNCTLERFANIAPGCVFCGGVKIGEGSHIGAGSTVLQTVEIGKNCMIGAGSVVTKNIPDCCKAYGVPCKIIEEDFKF